MPLFKRSIIVTAFCVWPWISSRAQTPLPKDISIVTPSAAVAKDAAAFSGAWVGNWGSELPGTLIVEQVNSNGAAKVVYAWGEPESHAFKAGWDKMEGQISKGHLKLANGGGPKIDFMLEPGGVLWGRYEMKDMPPTFAALRKLSATDGTAIREAVKKISAPWEEVWVPVHSEVGSTKGKTFKLQTAVFPQESGDKHPVVIDNHGSTGPGIIPASMVLRGGNEVEFFRSLGYAVVQPMRKGRGKSEGPNVEEDNSVTPAVALDSAVEDVHAVVEFVKKRSDVDPERIVVTGVSRGGILSVAYAGRYPNDVIGVINFSGGWFGEGMPEADFNFEVFAKAGHDAKVPMLWLYADHDSFYSLKFDEREFAKFKDSGGRGELLEVRDIAGEGHMLFMQVDKWRGKAIKYLSSNWTQF